MHHDDGFDFVRPVGGKPLFDRFGRSAPPPRSRHVVHAQAELFGGMPPRDLQVLWQVATDEGFTDVVRAGSVVAEGRWRTRCTRR